MHKVPKMSDSWRQKAEGGCQGPGRRDGKLLLKAYRASAGKMESFQVDGGTTKHMHFKLPELHTYR